MYIHVFISIYLSLCKIYFIYLLYFSQCVQIRGNCGILWNLDKNHTFLADKLNFNKYSFVNNKTNYIHCKLLNNISESDTHNNATIHVDEFDQFKEFEFNKVNDHVINKINLLSRDLHYKNLSRLDFIKKLTTIGREVYLDSPNNFLFQKLPSKANLLKEFDTNDLVNYNRDGKDHFIVKSPGCVKYKLLQDCSFFIYFSVFVDKNKFLYVDGTSESLIYRGIISILISIINNFFSNSDTISNIESILTNNHYIGDILYSNKIINNLLNHNIINKNVVDLIIKHIESEFNKQINLNSTIDSLSNSSTGEKRIDIAVLLSGGVDSSLSLWILKNRGYHVEAFYLQVNDINDDTGTCKSDDLKYAREVCNKIGVKLNVLPFSKLYYDDILKDFIENYKNGEVPNPDVWCNNKIKFGQFLDRAINWGFDYVASGHYASVVQDKSLNGGRRIRRLVVSKDPIKDQTYFLSKLNQFQLSKLIFPLERLTKQQVREYARIIRLPSYNKEDSVGLCFMEDLKISEYLLSKIGKNSGPIVDYKTNQIIGEHLGLFNYSIGQRKNLNNYIYTKCNPNTLRYVIKKDLNNNVLYVTEDYDSEEYTQPGGVRRSFKITDIFFNTTDYAEVLSKCKIEDNVDAHGDAYRLRVKLRHSPKFYDSITHFYANSSNDGLNSFDSSFVADLFSDDSRIIQGINCETANKYDSGIVYLSEADSGISTGQYCVFYLDDLCLGSAKMITTY
ncbi:tRNA-5-taurinomethyluridine 2-sulfurtransferase [Theileria orientalis]|uniref:tRNA-5-taurinomethyluridine 2-sulfurtransferase n=1 Tax=Theileria orientalis TaxID=68886 RepID=A0A976MCK7_THEOR|nr:tRNA-5-taurinomethyluridine 2-sulfurtransferase [Theileria orientalis]